MTFGKLADDLMIGTKPIANELGLSIRQAFYLLESGRLPAFKLGSRWAVRKSTLRAFLDDLERAAKAGV
jgi:hypothetical protein